MKPVKQILKTVAGVCLSIIFLLSPTATHIQAQQPKVKNGAEIKVALEKLLTLGNVLYIAAHPDDENTRVLAYFSVGRKFRAGYLSLNRGGGGQNLIGAEKGSMLSVLRTHELMAARRIDGTEQFFTRAIDFGYSKTSQESMQIWGKEKILEDAVFVIRKFRPDVILTRFPTDGRGRHGHHTASGILALEAYNAAGDPKRFPEQLKVVTVWKPKRIFWNSWVPYWGQPKPGEVEKLLKVDVGEYNRLLGKSYGEISALSRSMHKSQGFGAVARRGRQLDYFDLTAGDPVKKDVFEGIDTTWNRVPGSQKVKALLEKANGSYQAHQPSGILPVLFDALAAMKALPDSYWKTQKLKELNTVIRSCAGFWFEAIAERDEASPGQEIKVKTAIINRSDYPLSVKRIEAPGENKAITLNQKLENNKPLTRDIAMKITETQYTHPFWLRLKPEKGIFPAGNHRFKGLPVAPYPFMMKVVLDAKGREVTFETPVLYRWRDPVEGEKIRWLAVTPPVTVNFDEKVFYFASKAPKTVDMILRSGPAPVAGTLKFNLPSSWKTEPAQIAFDIKTPSTEKTVSVKITPPHKNAECDLTANLAVAGKTYDRSRLTIDYGHLPLLTLHPKAEARMIRVDIKQNGKNLGYIMGSGDDIPKYLEQVGYKVHILSDDELHHLDLSRFDAIITGVRAYNTRDILKHVQKRLLDYVKNGGRLIVQYNTHRRLKTEQIGPYPIKFQWLRVTEEDAAMTLLAPDHPLLNTPNKITAADFNGWIQERGLYFAGEWDPKYTAVLACNDKGEKPLKGGLLTASYGKGAFVFTGYSFFRQLPAGVGGALKLFVNMISLK
jgi:LmbE family N-acetylglucosaminyl deacetylase